MKGGLNTIRLDDYAKAGRWPANLLLSHLPECRKIGERKVELPAPIKPHRISDDYLYGSSRTSGTGVIASADGKTETVEIWECAEGCPVATLDEQSGDCSSPRANGNPNDPVHQPVPDQLMSWGGIRTTHDYRDTGGASRFFMTFPPEEPTCALCNLPLNRKHGITSLSENRGSEVIPCSNVSFVRATFNPTERANDFAEGHAQPNGPPNNEGKKANKNTPVNNAANNSPIMPATIAFIVRENVLRKARKKERPRCEVCGKPVRLMRNRYCSKSCSNKARDNPGVTSLSGVYARAQRAYP